MTVTEAAESLRRSGRALDAMLAGVPPDRARRRPAPDAWSLLEVARHLLDEEREDFRARIENLLSGTDAPFAPIDPAGWPASRRYQDDDLEETRLALRAEREASLAWLERLSGADWDRAKEMRFGPLRAGDLLASWVAHDLLHLRQLVALRYADLQGEASPYDIRYAGEW